MAERRKAANGSGTAYLRSDGRWAAEHYVTEAGTHRRVRRTVYGKSRAEVEEKLVDMRRREAAGTPSTPVQLTLEAYLGEWLSQVVALRVRPNTLAAYKFHVDRYLVPGLGKQRLGRLGVRDLRLYFDSLRRRGVGTRTIQYVHSTLRAALEAAVREELVVKNVAK